MTTIVNNPGDTSSSGTGFLMGAILLIAVGVLFLYFILPALNRGVSNSTGGSAPQIPNNIDVNVKGPEQPNK